MTPTNKPSIKPETRVSNPRRTTKSITEQLAHVTPEWADQLIAYSARQGDFTPLIDALLNGIELGLQTRIFLIDDFASGKPRKRGNKATWAQRMTDVEILHAVVCAVVFNQIEISAAVAKVANDKNMPRTTVKSVYDRTAPSFPEYIPKKVNGRWIAPWDGSKKTD